MRHRKTGVKLGRTSSHRDAMFRNMVTSLLKYDRIQTTDAKAKELRRWVDKIITLAKRGDLHARRQALSIVREKDVVHKLFEQAAQRFGSINGGYSRIVKIGRRPGDAAPMSMIELVSGEAKSAKSKKKKTKAPKKESPAPSAAAPKPQEPDEATPAEAVTAPEADVQDAAAAAPKEDSETPAEEKVQASAAAETEVSEAEAPAEEIPEAPAADADEDAEKK